MAFTAITDPNDPRLKTDFPLSSSGEECGTTGQSENPTDWRPTAPHTDNTTDGQPITDQPTTTLPTDCTKPDTVASIKAQQTLFRDPTDIVDASLNQILKTKEYPNGSDLAYLLAQRQTGSGNSVLNSEYVPPSTSAITNISGQPSNATALTRIGQTTQSINNLVNFSSLETSLLRQFIRMYQGMPGIKGLEQLPYFKPLSESIGSSITFLTDMSGLKQSTWIQNAASGMNVTTPISKLNRSKIHPGVVVSVDKIFQDLNHSLDLNLGQIFSQYAGFLSIFNSLLGLLPKEISSILGPIIGVATSLLGPLNSLATGGQGASNVVGQAAGFVGQIFSAYSQIARTAHGLDMIVDVIHHQRVLDKQQQMLSNLSTKFGDQLRVLNNQFPVKGGVKVGNSVQQTDIHGYAALTNLVGDKIIYTHYTDSVLEALKAIV